MTYNQGLIVQNALENEVSQASLELRKFPRTANGLTPDEVKFTPEFQESKAKFNAAFQSLRNFNASFTKNFKKEIRQTGKEKYSGIRN